MELGHTLKWKEPEFVNLVSSMIPSGIHIEIDTKWTAATER